MILLFLHRLRLRLGLFHWNNYAEIVSVMEKKDFPGWHPLAAYRHYSWWYRVTWHDAAVDEHHFDFRWQAISHIRRQVKKGVRP